MAKNHPEVMKINEMTKLIRPYFIHQKDSRTQKCLVECFVCGFISLMRKAWSDKMAMPERKEEKKKKQKTPSFLKPNEWIFGGPEEVPFQNSAGLYFYRLCRCKQEILTFFEQESFSTTRVDTWPSISNAPECKLSSSPDDLDSITKAIMKTIPFYFYLAWLDYSQETHPETLCIQKRSLKIAKQWDVPDVISRYVLFRSKIAWEEESTNVNAEEKMVLMESRVLSTLKELQHHPSTPLDVCISNYLQKKCPTFWTELTNPHPFKESNAVVWINHQPEHPEMKENENEHKITSLLFYSLGVPMSLKIVRPKAVKKKHSEVGDGAADDIHKSKSVLMVLPLFYKLEFHDSKASPSPLNHEGELYTVPPFIHPRSLFGLFLVQEMKEEDWCTALFPVLSRLSAETHNSYAIARMTTKGKERPSVWHRDGWLLKTSAMRIFNLSTPELSGMIYPLKLLSQEEDRTPIHAELLRMVSCVRETLLLMITIENGFIPHNPKQLMQMSTADLLRLWQYIHKVDQYKVALAYSVQPVSYLKSEPVGKVVMFDMWLPLLCFSCSILINDVMIQTILRPFTKLQDGACTLKRTLMDCGFIVSVE